MTVAIVGFAVGFGGLKKTANRGRFRFFMVPDFNHAPGKLLRIRERAIMRLVPYRNRYWVYRIKLYRLLLYRGKPNITCITAGSAAVNWLHDTG